MSKSKLNYRVYNGKIIKDILENSRVYILALLFTSGLLIGAFSLNSEYEITEKITDIASNFIKIKSEQGFPEKFFYSFAINSTYNIISLFLGFSLVGYPFLWWLPFLKGMGTGLLTGYLYSSFGFTGIGYGILIIYPGMIVSTFSLVLACSDSIIYSKNAFAKSIKGRGEFEKNETKIFLIRQIIYIIICIVSSITDALFSLIFSGLFEI